MVDMVIFWGTKRSSRCRKWGAKPRRIPTDSQRGSAPPPPRRKIFPFYDVRMRAHWYSMSVVLRISMGFSNALHYSDVLMGAIASQITSLTIVYSTVYSGTDQRKHQISASLAFGRVIYQRPVNSPHKWPVTRKMFPFDDVIMIGCAYYSVYLLLVMVLIASFSSLTIRLHL